MNSIWTGNRFQMWEFGGGIGQGHLYFTPIPMFSMGSELDGKLSRIPSLVWLDF